MKVSGIYCIENLVNNKKYIGQSVDIYARFAAHKSAMRHGRETSRELQQDADKYGTDNFSFTIIEECPEEKLDEREQYYIELYDTMNNGYNSATGGLSGFTWSDTAKKLISENHADVSGEKNPAYGKFFRDRVKDYDDWYKKWEASGGRHFGNRNWTLVKYRNTKPCKLYDIYGCMIESFSSQAECVEYLNLSYTTIVGKWINDTYFVEDDDHPFKYTTRVNPVVFNGIVFKTVTEAAKYMQISRGVLYEYMSGKRKTPSVYSGIRLYNRIEDITKLNDGTLIKYNGSDIYKVNGTDIINGHRCRAIYQKDLNGNIIRKFDSIKEASIETNTLDSSIIRCLQGKYKQAGGFTWEYVYKKEAA